ncbi:MAG TPA: asparaginase domain-containing protein [Thermoanaerobaculia bacterium]|nr:asparaginase domain-containing protein [Thermoanaerobaculia bacterium]
MRRVVVITTGGTIEKTYDEQTGELANRRSIVHRMLSELRLEEVEVDVVELMSKDSLEMTDADRDHITAAVGDALAADGGLAGVVVLHGTDTLTVTGERLHRELPAPPVAVVLTGAMRPFEMKRSDALQNLTEALFAARSLAPGVYCVAHGRALPFPGVVKDRDHGTFALAGAAAGARTGAPGG